MNQSTTLIGSTNLIASIREKARPTFLLFRVLILALVFAETPLVARAATVTVTTLADTIVNGDGCSLREAIEATNTDQAFNDCSAGSGDDIIDFDIQGTIQLNADLPTIIESLTIQGPGRDLLVLDGIDQFSMFHFSSGGVDPLLDLSDFTMTHSFGAPVGPVWVRSGHGLNMTNMLVSASWSGCEMMSPSPRLPPS